jgi:molybdenum cofactor cytidylyltransferase
MGSFKQLLTLGGKTFVECCVDNLLASRIGELIVVTGHRDDDVRAALAGRDVRFAHNANYQDGMASSIKCGLEEVSDKATACLIALVDQPEIGTDIFNNVIEAYRKESPLIVVPTYRGKRGHPVVLDLKLRNEILGMDPRLGLREIVSSHRQQTCLVETAVAILLDFDTPDDYRRVNED